MYETLIETSNLEVGLAKQFIDNLRKKEKKKRKKERKERKKERERQKVHR